MSKVRKKQIDRKRVISEVDIKFEKIIQFSGWMFLLGLGVFMAGWVIFDDIFNILTLTLDEMTFSFIIFIGTNSAVSFGLATKINKNPEKKQTFFLDWLLGEFLLCIIAIFAVAAYQW
ncbi:MAG: hypothetical protein KGD65_03010 [Candidatus Lokiarchaeota archaeon]|nr:hypothetical protein [Candidatus Lokiarchaeota archaeon]